MNLTEKGNRLLNISKTISFYKEDGIWYADVAGHSKEENEMVAGADVFLDKISQGKNFVLLRVVDDIYPKARILLYRINHDNGGATYIVLDNHSEAPALGGESFKYAGMRLWLCNVVHTFFGEHPEYISII